MRNLLKSLTPLKRMAKIVTANITSMKKIYFVGFLILFGSVLVYSTHANKDTAIDNQNTIPVKTISLTNAAHNQQVTFSGFIQGKNQTAVMPRINGYIARMHKKEGDRVQAGEVLAVLEASELSAAAQGSQMMIDATKDTVSATRNLFEQRVDESEEVLKQTKKKRDNGDTTSSDVRIAEEELKSAKRMRDAEMTNAFTGQISAESQSLLAQGALANTVVRAPFSGIILEKQASLGNLVSPGNALYTIASPEALELFVSVPRIYQKSLQKNMEVVLHSENGNESRGTIESISETLGNSAQIGVRISLSEEALQQFRIGDHAQATFRLEAMPSSGTLIPEEALVWIYDDVFVYTVQDNLAHLVPVTVGESIGNKRLITSGLENISIIITEGQHQLREGSAVTTTN